MSEEHKWYPVDKFGHIKINTAYFKELDLIALQDKEGGITMSSKDFEFTDGTLRKLGELVVRALKEFYKEDLKND